jgi:murein DD-endopeptidase MepM/ murein hydrolase activator NlpD
MRKLRTTWLKRCGEGHDVSGPGFFGAAWRECQFAARTLSRTSGFTSAAALTLALGLGFHTAIFSTVAFAAPGATLEVRVHPADYVYSYPVEQQRGLYSAVVQNVAVWSPVATCTLDAIDIQALRAGQPKLTVTLSARDLDSAAKVFSSMSQQGALKSYDFYFHTSRFLPDNLKLAATRTLEPGSAILIASVPMLFDEAVDEIAITARGTAADGKLVQTRTSLKVKRYQSSNDYHFPLAGTWYVACAPSLQSHHRWSVGQEFAIDLGSLGANSRAYEGQGAKLSDYDDYGKDVMAAADGLVIEAHEGAPESDSNLQQPGESKEAYQGRWQAQQDALLAKGYKEFFGNYVVIRHGGGEFSTYAHFRAGSVKVKKGDVVKRGQLIGQLGHSGNSTSPHLHFQVSDGPDPAYSRSIPVVFGNVYVEILGYENVPLQSGWIVTAKP